MICLHGRRSDERITSIRVHKLHVEEKKAEYIRRIDTQSGIMSEMCSYGVARCKWTRRTNRVVGGEIDRHEGDPDDPRRVHGERDEFRLVEVLWEVARPERVDGAGDDERRVERERDGDRRPATVGPLGATDEPTARPVGEDESRVGDTLDGQSDDDDQQFDARQYRDYRDLVE